MPFAGFIYSLSLMPRGYAVSYILSLGILHVRGARGFGSIINIKSEKTKRGTEIWSWHFGGAASIVAIIAHWGRIVVGYKDVKAFKRCCSKKKCTFTGGVIQGR